MPPTRTVTATLDVERCLLWAGYACFALGAAFKVARMVGEATGA